MRQTKYVLSLILAFTVFGLTVVFLTHEPSAEETNNFVSSENYVEHIRPWLTDFMSDRSSISETKQRFLDFKGSDQSIGPAHISLFLAFDSWDQLYVSDLEELYKQRAIEHFGKARELLPELKPEIDNLISMLEDSNGYY